MGSMFQTLNRNMTNKELDILAKLTPIKDDHRELLFKVNQLSIELQSLKKELQERELIRKTTPEDTNLFTKNV